MFSSQKIILFCLQEEIVPFTQACAFSLYAISYLHRVDPNNAADS